MGISAKEIHVEVVKYLGLPGFHFQGDALVASILEGAPAPPKVDFSPFKVLEGGKGAKKKAPRPKKVSTKRMWEEGLKWAILPAAENLDQTQYERRHRLNYYCRAPAGKVAVVNAVRLWKHGLTREIVCAAFLRGMTAVQVSDLLRSRMPKAKRAEINATRPLDLETFQDLFWDFRDWSPSERASFLDRYPGLMYATAALTQPLDVVLSRMGLQPLKADKNTTRELVKQLTMTWIYAQKGKIHEAATPAGLLTAYGVMQAVWADEESEAGSDSKALEMLQKTNVRVLDDSPITGFDELMQRQTRVTRYEDVNTALSIAAISEAEAEEYREMIGEGVDIGTALRDRIASVQADLVQDDSSSETA